MKKLKRVQFSRPTRTLALIMTVLLISSTFLSSLAFASRVKIPQPEKQLSSAAESYLANSTPYVNDPLPKRMADYIGAKTRQDTLQDYYSLACVQIAQEEYSQALVNIETCLSMYVDEGEYLLIDLWLKKGCLHVLLGEYDRAIPALDKVLVLDPEVADAYLVKAQVCEMLGLTRDICLNLGRFLELAPGSGKDEAQIADLWLHKGTLHVTLVEYTEALSALDAALAINGNLSKAYLVKAQIYALLGLNLDMCASLEAYLAIEPDDEDMKQLLAETWEELTRPLYQEVAPPRPSVESEFLEGLYAMQEEDYAGAEAAISRAIAIDSGYEGVYFYRGVCRLSLEDYAGAAEDFQKSISYGYMVQSSHYNCGVSLIMSDNDILGREEIRLAAALDEDMSVKTRAESLLMQIEEAETAARLSQYLSLAQVCADLEDYKGVRLHLESFLTEYPDDRQIRAVLAQALSADGEHKLVMEQYQLLLEDGPNAEYEYYYGFSALQLQDFATAQDAFTRSIDLSDEWPYVYYYRGVCYLSLEDYASAASDFTTSIRLKYMVHSSFFNRGICQLLLDDYEPGLADIRTAAGMEEDPEIKEQAQQLLASIETESEEY